MTFALLNINTRYEYKYTNGYEYEYELIETTKGKEQKLGK